MSVIKRYEVKTGNDTVETYDLGAEAVNVSTSDGSDVETALGVKMNSSPLSGSADLDEVLTPGFYRASSENTCANKPTSATMAFGLEVVWSSSFSGYVRQTLWRPNGMTYRRWRSNSVWGDWERIDEVLMQTELSDEDLDDVKTTGYYIGLYGNTCANTPFTGAPAFGLEVMHVASGDYYIQTLYHYTLTNRIHRRWCNNGTWSAWTTLYFTDTTYSAATSSAAGLMSASDKAAVDNMQSYSETAVQIGTWIDGSAVLRVCGSVSVSSLSDIYEDYDISGVNSSNASVILRQTYWYDSTVFNSYVDLYAASPSGAVCYCVEYVGK